MLDCNSINPNTGLTYTDMELQILNEKEQTILQEKIEAKKQKELRAIKSEVLAEIKVNARAAFIKEVGTDIFDIIKALKDRAMGRAWIEKMDKGGHKVTIKEAPSVEAGIYLINQMIGKPTETVEHTGHVTLQMDD